MVLGSSTLKPLPRGPEDVEKTLTQLRVSEPQILVSRQLPNSGVVSVFLRAGLATTTPTWGEGEELGCP